MRNVKIIKPARPETPQTELQAPEQKPEHGSIADTVSNWIAEYRENKRQSEQMERQVFFG